MVLECLRSGRPQARGWGDGEVEGVGWRLVRGEADGNVEMRDPFGKGDAGNAVAKCIMVPCAVVLRGSDVHAVGNHAGTAGQGVQANGLGAKVHGPVVVVTCLMDQHGMRVHEILSPVKQSRMPAIETRRWYGSDMVVVCLPHAIRIGGGSNIVFFSDLEPKGKVVQDSFLARDDFLAPVVTDRND